MCQGTFFVCNSVHRTCPDRPAYLTLRICFRRRYRFRTISVQQLAYLLDGELTFTLLDVREQREYEAGHLLGAVNLPYERLDEVEAEIPKDRPVVIYCAYGGQSLLAARKLAGCGYDAVNALGGLHYYRGKYYVRCKE